MMRRADRGWAVQVDPAIGARVSSLRDPAGREWLWRHPDPAIVAARERVRPGDPFVDAGGWEECFPTITGASDHGDIWSRPWRPDGDALAVTGGDFTLRRDIIAEDARLAIRYRLEADAGFRFVWAAHMLLDLSPGARLEAAPDTPCRCWPNHWRSPGPAASIDGPWPAPLGTPLDRLAPDGSALFFMLLAPGPLAVTDDRRLTLRLDAPGQPAAIAVWRNLGGWPPDAPYRSIGVEPAIGRHYDRDLAAPGDLGTVGPAGVLEWTLWLESGKTSGA